MSQATNIRREMREGGIAVLTFDRANSGANIFDEPTLQELRAEVAALASDPSVKGVALASAKSRIFMAGADIKSVLSNPDPGEMDRLIQLGQDAMNDLAALKVPTAAAIHGAALGGGLEVALACDWRVASDDRATKIGLPETQLGILPAWGGSTRLPRLVGIPKAADLILGGKQLGGAHAKALGVVDEVVAREHLIAMAVKLLARGKRKPKNLFLLNNPLTAAIVRKKAGAALEKKTRGHYPALPAALDAVTRAPSRTVEESLRAERTAVSELGRGPAATNLIRVFFLQERAKKLTYPPGAKPESPPAPIRNVAVIGAGVMGAGIAQWLASRGAHVLLTDLDNAALARGMATADKLIGGAVKRRIFSKTEAQAVRDRITPVAGRPPLNRIDLVIEAAVEKLDIKKKIFADLAERTGPDTILATNTSALPIGAIGEAAGCPERVLGIHFFNPVHLMKLVEIVVADQTSDANAARALAFIQGVAKLPVVARDQPGFIVNRILMPYMVEAGRLFESGAPAAEVDAAMLDFGMPMGPLRLIDEVGADVALHVVETLRGAFGERLAAPPILTKMVEAKMLGKKSGSGFYTYAGKGEAPNAAAESLRGAAADAMPDRAEMADRMVALMVNEAARCLEENVAAAPEDIDFAMIMGAGFAPFRGGVLRHADATGVDVIAEQLQRFAAKGGKRFDPCARLAKMAQDGGAFYA
ncbi:MAG: 3-hydroxyacyl-CoA dehydrogenase NAD-binding domain-containing protein [Verrucomicrobiales bacterium]